MPDPAPRTVLATCDRAAAAAAETLCRVGRVALLSARAGEHDKAADYFAVAAEAHCRQRRLAMAASCYETVLTFRPGDLRALVRLGEIACEAGRFRDAHGWFAAAAEQHLAEGKVEAASALRGRIDALDLAEVQARLDAARASAGRDPLDLLEPDSRARAGREMPAPAGISAPHDRRAATSHETTRTRMLALCLSMGELQRAARYASTAVDWKALAAALGRAGRPDEALDAWCEAARIDRGDTKLRAWLARAFVARGDAVAAAEFLDVQALGDDRELLFAAAETQLRGGRVAEGIALMERILAESPAAAEEVAELAGEAARHAPEVACRLLELALLAAEDLAAREPADPGSTSLLGRILDLLDRTSDAAQEPRPTVLSFPQRLDAQGPHRLGR